MPVLAGPQGKLCLVEVEGLPEVTVTNLETQHAFTVDLGTDYDAVLVPNFLHHFSMND